MMRRSLGSEWCVEYCHHGSGVGEKMGYDIRVIEQEQVGKVQRSEYCQNPGETCFMSDVFQDVEGQYSSSGISCSQDKVRMNGTCRPQKICMQHLFICLFIF